NEQAVAGVGGGVWVPGRVGTGAMWGGVGVKFYRGCRTYPLHSAEKFYITRRSTWHQTAAATPVANGGPDEGRARPAGHQALARLAGRAPGQPGSGRQWPPASIECEEIRGARLDQRGTPPAGGGVVKPAVGFVLADQPGCPRRFHSGVRRDRAA